MQYDFDKVIDRKGTDSVKYDILKDLFGKEDILPMWVADMDFEAPDFVQEAIMERARHGIYGYTTRPARFYESISGWMDRRHGWRTDPSWIDFSPGVVPALVMMVLGYTEPGDRVLVQSPVYFPFFSAIKNHGRELINNQLVDRNGEYSMDFAALEDTFRKGVKMMMLCHPHNPVGRAWKREELEKLAALALEYKVLILSDEIHSDLVLFGNKHVPFASLGKEISMQTITCVAPSKTFNLAGLHTSAVIIENKELKKKYQKILEDIHVGGGNIFGFTALEAAYNNGEDWLKQLIGYLEKNYLFLVNTLKSELPAVRVSPLEATYLAWMNFSTFGLTDRELMQLMVEEAGLAFVDGPRFGDGGSQYLRMNIACPRTLMEEAVERMVKAISTRFP